MSALDRASPILKGILTRPDVSLISVDELKQAWTFHVPSKEVAATIREVLLVRRIKATTTGFPGGRVYFTVFEDLPPTLTFPQLNQGDPT